MGKSAQFSCGEKRRIWFHMEHYFSQNKSATNEFFAVKAAI
jgi:hypothetical protein